MLRGDRPAADVHGRPVPVASLAFVSAMLFGVAGNCGFGMDMAAVLVSSRTELMGPGRNTNPGGREPPD